MNDLAFDFLKESKGLVGNMGSFKVLRKAWNNIADLEVYVVF